MRISWDGGYLYIAICDDSREELMYVYKIIEKALSQYKITCQFQVYTSASKMLEDNYSKPFDAIFLDLDMPEIDGMDVAAKINKINESTEIIFVTNHDELVYKAYRFKALGFIRKKYLNAEINEILEILINTINSRQKYLIFCDSGVDKKYKVQDIIYMHSDDHYVDIISLDDKCSVRDSLNNIEKSYSQYGFIRIHSRYLVNFRYIYSIEKNTIVLNGKQQLPMSRNRVSAVKELLQFYSRRL